MPPLYGLAVPDVEIFGFHVTAQQLVIAAALTLLFGWRMLAFLAILCAFWPLHLQRHCCVLENTRWFTSLSAVCAYVRREMASHQR